MLHYLLQDCQNDWNDAECAIKCVPVTDPSTNITYSKLYKVQQIDHKNIEKKNQNRYIKLRYLI